MSTKDTSPQSQGAADEGITASAREAVNRFVAEIDQSVIPLKFERSEDRGEEIWFFYKKDYSGTPVVSAAHNENVFAYIKATGKVEGRNP